jgi:hypothetical protein
MDEQPLKQVLLACISQMKALDRELQAHRRVLISIQDAVVYPSIKDELQKVRDSPELIAAIDEKYAPYFSRLASVVQGEPDQELRLLLDEYLVNLNKQ